MLEACLVSFGVAVRPICVAAEKYSRILRHANEAHDPRGVAYPVAVPATREFRRMQVGLVSDRKKQAMISSPVLHERGDVQPQMKCRLRFGCRRLSPTLNGVAIDLLPNSPVIAFGSEQTVRARNALEPVSLGDLVGIVTILTRKDGLAALRAAPAVRINPNLAFRSDAGIRTPAPNLEFLPGSWERGMCGVRRCPSYGLAVFLRIGFRC